MNATVTIIPIKRNRYDDGYTSDAVITTPSRYGRRALRFGIGYVGPQDSARRVQGGPQVPGPWAFLYPLASVIDNQGGTVAERARLLAAGLEHDLDTGAAVEVDGRTFVITDDRPFAYPALEIQS